MVFALETYCPATRRLLRGPDRGGGRRDRPTARGSSRCSRPRSWSSPTRTDHSTGLVPEPDRPPAKGNHDRLRLDRSPTCHRPLHRRRVRAGRPTVAGSTCSTRRPGEVHRDRRRRHGRGRDGRRRRRRQRAAAAGRRPRRASAPRSCGAAFELMTERADELARLISLRERQGAAPTRAARSRTPRSSSAGTPKRRCAPRAP